MNAARALVAQLPRATVRRLAAATIKDDDGAVAAGVGDRFAGDLAGLLNRLRIDELRAVAHAVAAAVPSDAPVGDVRARVWAWGARAEAGGDGWLGTPVQPVPELLGARLVHVAPARGLAPPSPSWPRPVPAPRAAAIPPEEPADVDELLAAADRALGVRLPGRGRDKGAWGRARRRCSG
ncbi:MAG: hypothetical protein IPL61_38690 [Myxococcales bacterium]|nr:hypothetical protein [Myxococcales bacterium]